MTESIYKVVLSDKLYSIYKKASTQCPLKAKERKAYDALVGNVELDILTNAAQLQRCKDNHKLPDEVYDDLHPVLLTSDDKDLPLHDLSKKTLFKLILTQANGETLSPYFNLKEKHIKRNYTISRLHDEDRQYLKDYLKNLLIDADKIFIYDNFFSKEEANKQLFNLFPNKNILIQYVENSDRDNGNFIQYACNGNAKWKVEKCDTTQDEFNRFARSHDRYLIINDKVEVTLTSGFLYIWNEDKEITCVIREV